MKDTERPAVEQADGPAYSKEAVHHPGQPRGSVRAGRSTIIELLLVSSRLGLTSFGGPVAHLGYFREEYVVRRRWLDDAAYADLVALCQFLPGPASSQVGMAIGMMRGGFWGGVASWLGFTLPSAAGLMLFAALLQDVNLTGAGWLHGLLVAAVAVVAHAIWGMARSLTPDRIRAGIAIAAAIGVLAVPTAVTQVVVIVLGGLMGQLLLKPPGESRSDAALFVPVPRAGAVAAWVLFFGLLVGLPLLQRAYPAPALAVVDSFYRAGSLVFGGGHVVLPLLQTGVVGPGWMTAEQFLAGYGAAQVVPGPLFTFAAYLGAVMGGWPMGLLATVAIFLPSFLLVAGALPYWDAIRRRGTFQAALQGVNAAVVGLLLAAFYDPVWTKAIHSPLDFGLALAAFGLLAHWRAPAWLVVAAAALAGEVMARLT